jgi:hypothetical protein
MDRSTRARRPRLALAALVALVVAGCAGSTSSGSPASAAASLTPTPGVPAGTSTPTDPAAALRIAAPWALDDEFPEVRQQILDGVLAEEGVRMAQVRHVTGPDGESAFLLAADAGLAAEADLESWTQRVSTSSLTGAAIESIGEHEVALLQTDEVSIAAWLEPPLLLAVYAADGDTARRIATAVLDTP